MEEQLWMSSCRCVAENNYLKMRSSCYLCFHIAVLPILLLEILKDVHLKFSIMLNNRELWTCIYKPIRNYKLVVYMICSSIGNDNLSFQKLLDK